MKIKTSFELNQKVYIVELEIYGRIKAIWVTYTGTQYLVRYFWNDEVKEVYLFEAEIIPAFFSKIL